MKFIFSDLGIQLQLTVGIPAIFQIEHPAFATELISDFQKQIAGEDGKCLFVDSDKEVSFAKQIEVILNPFELDFSSKKIQTKLFKELQNISIESQTEEFAAVRQAVYNYLDTMIESAPYPIQYNEEFDENAIFRMVGIQISHSDEGFVDNIVSYIKVLSRLCGIKLFIILNLTSLLTEQQWQLFEVELKYLEIYVMCIEVVTNRKICSNLIVDSDLCVL